MSPRLARLPALFASLLTLGALALHAADSPAPAAPASRDRITPGAIWPDDRGRHIQAHGGGILKQGDTYYWFGEDRSPDNPKNARFVACYSSRDLINWEFRNQVFKSDDPENLGPRW